MSSVSAIRNVERALDDLRRGEAVCLSDGTNALQVRAAECVAGNEKNSLRLVLSGRRAKYLGLSEDERAVRIEIIAGNAAALPPLLYAPRLEQTIAAVPANALEQQAVQLVREAGFLPAALVDVAQALPGTLEVNVQEIAAYRLRPLALTLDSMVRLPLAVFEDTRAAAFKEQGGLTHLALLLGHPEKQPSPLVRLHSACLTGDLLSSLRCDCGEQLQATLHVMAAEGSGVLLYLNQEGRGIGLLNKLRAYRLQEQGLDTVDANLALGFSEDERDFAIAAHMLRALNIKNIRLLTNNPQKIEALEGEGIAIKERLPLAVKPGEHNKDYLATKASRLGHQH